MPTKNKQARWPCLRLALLLQGFCGAIDLNATETEPLLVLSADAAITEELNGLSNGGETVHVPAETVVVGMDRLPASASSPAVWRVRLPNATGSSTGYVLASQAQELPEFGERLLRERVQKSAPEAELPLSIASAGDPTLIAAWGLAAEAVAENEQLPAEERLPDPYFASAAVLLAVGDSVGAADYCSKGAAYQLPEDAGNAQLQLRRLTLFTNVLAGLREVPAPVVDEASDHTGIVAQRLSKASELMARKEYSDAEKELTNALAFRPADPLIWYLRAYSRSSQGAGVAAQSDAIIGAWLERRLPGTAQVRVSKNIERLQGSRRLWLESFRNGTAQVSLTGGAS